MSRITIYDCEVSPKKSMVGFLDYESGKIKQFQHDESEAIIAYVEGRTLVGFNNIAYDNVIVSAMMRGKKAKDIYKMSVDLIEHDGKHWDYINLIKSNIDIREVAKGDSSLKLYGSRLNTKKLQDLPYDPHVKHTKKMWKEACKYNINDLYLTKELYEFLLPQLDIRAVIGKQYDINVMSKSDAQVAESIFEKELGINKRKIRIERPKFVNWDKPDWITFKSKELNDLVNKIADTTIRINTMTGKPLTPEILKKKKIEVAGNLYTIGLGGIHSNEKSISFTGDLGNIDVESYYPATIINSKLYPPHLGEEWLTLYTKIRDERVVAKANGDKVKSDVFKIILNGSFGKLGSQYSFLYAPHLLINITMTGQFSLLMLIEAIENKGIKVISANTDGIEIRYNSKNEHKVVKKLVTKWEELTGYKMEYGFYKGLYSRDVNAYIAIYEDEAKRKGFYSEPKIDKNIEYPIITDAISEFLLNGTPINKTINECTDVAKFCVARQVNGGAVWSPEDYPDTEEYENYIVKVPFKQNKALEARNQVFKRDFILQDADKWYLGKVVRYYYSTDGKKMYGKLRGNLIGNTDEFNGVKPMMELSEKIPEDLDYEAYYLFADRYLKEAGYGNEN